MRYEAVKDYGRKRLAESATVGLVKDAIVLKRLAPENSYVANKTTETRLLLGTIGQVEFQLRPARTQSRKLETMRSLKCELACPHRELSSMPRSDAALAGRRTVG